MGVGLGVRAECVCGLSAELLIGGGMFNFTTFCAFPCACETCHQVVNVNLLDRDVHCPLCGAAGPLPFDDPRLAGAPGDHAVAEWNVENSLGRVLVLTDGTYRCPRCGQNTLRFVDTGLCWD
jgi:hypothetical protein